MDTFHVEEFTPLAERTTMRTGGSARYFTRLADIQDVPRAVDFARAHNVPFFVLGGGSNVLVPDDGFEGLIINLNIRGIEYQETLHGAQVVVSAGEVWDDVVRDVVARGLWGIENLSLIPGTVGGAAVQNIGAYGAEFCDRVVWVEAYDVRTMSVHRFLRDECAFAYRMSIFKKEQPNLIVERVALELFSEPHPHIQYEDVQHYFASKNILAPSLLDIRNAIIEIRQNKLPPPTLGTAGSFFKNPIVMQSDYVRLAEEFPGIKSYPLRGGTTVKLSAAWLLDHVGGWRGVRHGDAGVYDRQVLVLVNHGTASTSDMLALARVMKESIQEKTGVLLEEEVVMVK